MCLVVPSTCPLPAHLRTSKRGGTVLRTKTCFWNSSASGSVTLSGARESRTHAKTAVSELHPPTAPTSVQSKEESLEWLQVHDVPLKVSRNLVQVLVASRCGHRQGR